MSRKFIAAILAVSTTLAAFSAAPARAASQQDIAKFLGAAATIFFISQAIENSRDRDSYDKKTKKPVVHQQRQFIHEYRPIPKVAPRNVRPRHTQRTAIPQRCVRRITGGNVRRVAMGRCLQRHYTSARPLPRACRMTVATQRGERRAYALPCLRNRGYKIARN